eukprot:TRINITY_DN1377_c0_g1_i1.p1 TRINITY_DN1377_c0_g1~~TRINITY_DN1377_c0_g1_i1.p1  ORF type:complete len:664 (+),score=226.56 TRINITY_DN1377_c0_g1_i1:274-2265(+)
MLSRGMKSALLGAKQAKLFNGHVAYNRNFSTLQGAQTGEPVIGIDLGTTFSAVAIPEGTSARILENTEGARTTPSVVGFLENGEIVVGALARRQAVTNPTNTITAVKRLIGRRANDPEISSKYKVPYKICSADNGDAWVEVKGKKYSPSHISSFTLTKMKQTAEAYLGKPVKDAVITVPAYFDSHQRQATQDAGRIAGLNVLKIINEPTAAALAFGIKETKAKTIAVYDLGGGTFDISILTIEGGVFEVRATNGDTFLGGEDFDAKLQDYLLEEFKKANAGHDLSKDPLALQRVREAAEKAKIELSSAKDTEINLPYVTVKPDGTPLHLNVKLSRGKFEQLVKELIDRSIEPTAKCIKDAKMTVADIDEVVLVGGMTRMPAVQTIVKNFFRKDPCKGVNPDEAVAIGAAIQGGIMTKKYGGGSQMVLVDVTPLTLGIETVGGTFTGIIDRNTTIPIKRSKVFTTAEDAQTEVEVKVLQGERSMASDNKLLGKFILDGLPPVPRGVPQIEVIFDVDASGVVHVNAIDKKTGKSQAIKVQAKGGLSEDEIQNLIKEAEANKELDNQRKEAIDAKNEAEKKISTFETNVATWKESLTKADQEAITTAITDLRAAMPQEGAVPEKIREAIKKLDEVALPAFERAYNQGAAKSSNAGDANNASGNKSS